MEQLILKQHDEKESLELHHEKHDSEKEELHSQIAHLEEQLHHLNEQLMVCTDLCSSSCFCSCSPSLAALVAIQNACAFIACAFIFRRIQKILTLLPLRKSPCYKHSLWALIGTGF